MRGVAHISAVTIASELGNISSRFQSARKLMGYCGVFPSEDSSGNRVRRGGITKAGNAHLRRIVVESAWCYRHLPRVGEKLRKRHDGVPPAIIEIAWKAQNRLHKRYMKLSMADKDQRTIMPSLCAPAHAVPSINRGCAGCYMAWIRVSTRVLFGAIFSD